MGKRIGPEAKIIALFNELSGESKRIVYDVIKSQQPVKRATVKRPKKVAETIGEAE